MTFGSCLDEISIAALPLSPAELVAEGETVGAVVDRLLDDWPQSPALVLVAGSNQCRGLLPLDVLMRARADGAAAAPVAGYARLDTLVSLDTTVREAAKRLRETGVDALAVVDERRLLGVLGARQLTAWMAERFAKAGAGHDSDTERLVAYVAHDIRNPLSLISAVAHTLEKRDLSDTQQDRMVGLLQRASRQALELSDSLLHMERYRGLGGAERRPLDLADFLRAFADENGDIVRQRGRELVVEPGVPVTVAFDSALVKRILLNLVDNACKHGPPQSRVFVAAVVTAESVELSVRDEGAGLAPSDAATVFQPFRQIDSDAAALGYGLGLAIVRRFAEMHAGTVHVTSGAADGVSPSGAKFVVTLPASVQAVSRSFNRTRKQNQDLSPADG
jgi:signal transduction histidine kinase